MPKKAELASEAKPGESQYRSKRLDTKEAELEFEQAIRDRFEARMEPIDKHAANDPTYEPPEMRAARAARKPKYSDLWIDHAESLSPEVDSEAKPSVGPID
ncbi:hypothetical protein EXS54_00250 [Patescibacteria group bacterium]|nr:hypothetical protein [Patescibacteria group bacterium]